MSRLTELIKHYEFMVEDLARSYEITTRHMEMGEIKIHKEFCQRIDDALDALKELQHYKDLEEQGRLIELPCKVGDYVYDIVDSTAYKTKVIQFLIHGEGVACRTVSSFPNAEHFGTRIFLTKEEAERKLAKLKGAEE